MFNLFMKHFTADMTIKAIQTHVQVPAEIAAPKYPFFQPIRGRVYICLTASSPPSLAAVFNNHFKAGLFEASS